MTLEEENEVFLELLCNYLREIEALDLKCNKKYNNTII